MSATTSQRTALVTGGASGLGLAVVRGLREDGFTTVSLDLGSSDEAHISVIGDVREPVSHAAAVRAGLEQTGRLDVLIANAGVHDGGVGLEVEPDELRARLRQVLDVDVVGYALAIQAAASPLREASGHVVLTLSDASFMVGQQGAGLAYTAAKHAALGLLGWAARELAPEVRVNAVAPGGVVTGLRAVGGDDDEARQPVFDDPDAVSELIQSLNPMRTILTPDEVAQHYRWLVSASCPGLTGQVIRPDGGLVVR